MDTYKKVIQFKINRRPNSSQFNASSYVSRGSVEHGSDNKSSQFRRKNVASLKKAYDKYEIPRRGEQERRNFLPKRRFETPSHDYNEFRDQSDANYTSDQYNVAEVVKVNHSEKYSPRTKKRFQYLRNDLNPIKPISGEASPSAAQKLEKRPSRKLVIRDRKSEKSSPQVEVPAEAVEQSESVYVNHEERKIEGGVIKKQIQEFKSEAVDRPQESKSEVKEEKIEEPVKVKQPSEEAKAEPIEEEPPKAEEKSGTMKNIEEEHTAIVNKYEEKVRESYEEEKRKATEEVKPDHDEVKEAEPIEVEGKAESSNGGYEDLMM